MRTFCQGSGGKVSSTKQKWIPKGSEKQARDDFSCFPSLAFTGKKTWLVGWIFALDIWHILTYPKTPTRPAKREKKTRCCALRWVPPMMYINDTILLPRKAQRKQVQFCSFCVFLFFSCDLLKSSICLDFVSGPVCPGPKYDRNQLLRTYGTCKDGGALLVLSHPYQNSIGCWHMHICKPGALSLHGHAPKLCSFKLV